MDDPLKVLVVDDQPEIRNVLEETLTRLGHSVRTAESGGNALRHLRDERFEVVLLDITMPGIDGMEVLKAIRGNGSDTEVVMMSGYATVESAVTAMKLGAYDVIQKPLILRDVDRVLRDAVESHRLGQPRAARPEGGDGAATPPELLGVDPKILGSLASAAAYTPNLAELDERHIRHVLSRERWNVSRAARVLGIHRATLYRKIVAFGIRPESKKTRWGPEVKQLRMERG